MRALLDINVLIALLDAAHTMHRPAWGWLEKEVENGWASCPLTENGVVRIMSQPSYPNSYPAPQVAARLSEACQSPEHVFWPGDISLLTGGVIEWKRLLGPRQITDTYLLALAVKTRGVLLPSTSVFQSIEFPTLRRSISKRSPATDNACSFLL